MSRSAPRAQPRPAQAPRPQHLRAGAGVEVAPETIGWDEIECVIVTYRSIGQVRDLFPTLPPQLRVVVVDNSEDVDGIRALAEQRPGTRYVDAGGIGFARAANLGARTSDRTYLLFLNPDARPGQETLAAIVREVADDDRLAACAAMPTGAQGRGEIGVGGWEPSVRRALIHACGLHKLRRLDGLFAAPTPGEQVSLDWVTGACLAVRRERFEQLGHFDEDFYVYNEDMAFGRAARQAGFEVRLRTDLPVGHRAGGSGAPSKEMLRLRGASMARYLRTNTSRSTEFGVLAALCAGSAARGVAALARRRSDTAVGYREYIRGMLTRHAYVGSRRIY